jgi:hypothetical protein
MDKQKIIEFLEDEIESCEIVGNESDKSIIWECKRILKRINAGTFDIDSDNLGDNRIEFETYRKCVRGEI